MLHLLRTLKYKGKDVTDADILEWANVKVKASGKKTHIESFKVIRCRSNDFVTFILWKSYADYKFLDMSYCRTRAYPVVIFSLICYQRLNRM